MKKGLKKLSCLLLAALMLCSMFSMTSWADNSTSSTTSYKTSAGNYIYVPTKVAVYYDGTGTQTESITISGLKSSQNVTKSSVKSSNKKVAKLYSLSRYKHSNEDQYLESGSSYSYEGGYAEIRFTVKGTGTSKISYKVAGKTFTTTVKSYAYTNPLSSVKISGVSKKANVAGKMKKTDSATVTLASTQKNPEVIVKAASGWKVTQISVNYYNNNESWYNSYYNSNGGTSKVTVYPGRLTKGMSTFLNITLKNTSTGGEITCTYTIK